MTGMIDRHLKIKCCFCGSAALVDLRHARRFALKCEACGAPLRHLEARETTTAQGSGPGDWQAPKPKERWRRDHPPRETSPYARRRDYQEHRKEQKRRRRGAWDRFKDILDDIEDIFD